MAKVLVIEDEANVAAIVRYHFDIAGLEGIYAGTGEAGWRLLVAERPDALVTDIGVQGAESWSLIERVRADGRFRELPVVVLAGDEAGNAERAARSKCIYLTKPFAATALIDRVTQLIKDGERRPVAGQESAIELVSVGVKILLDGYQVEGTVHLPPELGRFSDAWESIVRDPRTFFPVTEATVTSTTGDHIATTAFIEVRKSEVRAVFPRDITAG
jgi:DNA-binding response OmpR family regulator